MREKIVDPYYKFDFSKQLRKKDKTKFIGHEGLRFAKNSMINKINLNSTENFMRPQSLTPLNKGNTTSKPFLTTIKPDTLFFTNFEYMSDPYKEAADMLRIRKKENEIHQDFILGGSQTPDLPKIASIRSKKAEDLLNHIYAINASKSPRIFKNSVKALYEPTFTPSIQDLAESPYDI